MHCRIRKIHEPDKSQGDGSCVNIQESVALPTLPPPLDIYGAISQQFTHPNSKSFITRSENGKRHYVRCFRSSEYKTEQLMILKKEITYIKGINDSHLCPFDSEVISKDCIILVRQYVPGQSLDHFISKNVKINYSTTLNFAIQIIETISIFHKINIPMQTIDLSNIILNSEGVLVFVDYGVNPILKEYMNLIENEPVIKFIPPEVMTGQTNDITIQQDIWKLGIVLYAMFTKTLPWSTRNLSKLMQEIIASDIDGISNDVDPAVSSIIKNMLSPNPKARPTIETVLMIFKRLFAEKNQTPNLPALNIQKPQQPNFASTTKSILSSRNYPSVPPLIRQQKNPLNQSHQNFPIQQPSALPPINIMRAPRRI